MSPLGVCAAQMMSALGLRPRGCHLPCCLAAVSVPGPGLPMPPRAPSVDQGLGTVMSRKARAAQHGPGAARGGFKGPAAVPCFSWKNQGSFLNPASHPVLLQWPRRGTSPVSAWHPGTAPSVAVVPTGAVSHPQPCPVPGGVPAAGATAPSEGSPEPRVRFRWAIACPVAGTAAPAAAGGTETRRGGTGWGGSWPRSTLLLLLFLLRGPALSPRLLCLLRGFNADCPRGELECPWSRRDQFCQIPPPREAKL